MKAVFFTLVFFTTVVASAHPGIGIVKDSKGFIYYTDLENVYRFDPATNRKTVAVHHVHTHELFIDKSDNLYGEHLWFKDEGTNRFDHYLWRLNSRGKLDTIAGPSRAYSGFDFSIFRDNNGNEYCVDLPAANRIVKRTKDGVVTGIVAGNFEHLAWLHTFDDGSLYFTLKNALYRVVGNGPVVKVAGNIAAANSSAASLYRVWRKPNSSALYIAVGNDRAVKRITANGRVELVFAEKDAGWFPTGGIFDNRGALWLLEYSTTNRVRVIKAPTFTKKFQAG